MDLTEEFFARGRLYRRDYFWYTAPWTDLPFPGQIRSESAYEFEDGDADKIVAVSAFHSKEHRLAAISFGLTEVVTHGTSLFRASLHTGVAKRVTPGQFYEVLCTEKCSVCRKFGSMVMLITWARCYTKCLEFAP